MPTPEGWPAQLADSAFSPERYGFVEFQSRIDAVVMGRSTFEPALRATRWPWPNLDVFVLASHRPENTPDDLVVAWDPAELLEQMRTAHPKAFRRVGALEQPGLIVLAHLLGSDWSSHWSDMTFGYFPTYQLGNIISVQLFERAEVDIGDLDERFERGEFGTLRDWLREHVHRHGRRLEPIQLLRAATGTEIDPDPYLAHLERRLADQGIVSHE